MSSQRGETKRGETKRGARPVEPTEKGLGQRARSTGPADPRIKRSMESVLAAALDLFVTGGPRAVTVDAVSERSGVAKTTIYRHWSDRAHLLADTYRACLPVVPEPGASLSPQEALREVTRSLVRGMGTEPARPALPHLIATPLDPVESRALPADVMDQTFAPVVGAIQRCAAAGLIPAGTDVAEAKHQLVGFVIMSGLDASCVMDDALADRIVALFLSSRSSPPAT